MPSGPQDSDAFKRVVQRIQATTGRWSNGAKIEQIRTDFEVLLAGPEPAQVLSADIAGRPASIAAHPGSRDDAVILFVHGGGFQIGSLRSHRSLMSRLAHLSGIPVIGIDYRLAPEHRYPSALEDCRSAYRDVQQRFLARRVLIAGDSAGGHLALSLALSVRDAGLPLPAGIALISPWLDLALRGASYASRAEADVFSKPAQLRAMARTYLGREIDPASLPVSPLDAPLHGLPRIHVQAGEADITLDDAITLAERASAAGVIHELRVWPGMFHHFQVFDELDEARQSLLEIAAFAKTCLDPS